MKRRQTQNQRGQRTMVRQPSVPVLTYLLVLLLLMGIHLVSVSLAGEATELKEAARAEFQRANPDKARVHLAALLDLYRAEHAGNPSHQGTYQWSRRLAEVAHEYLRAGQLDGAMTVLGEAADLNLPPREEFDDGLASAAAGLYRRLAALDAGERFELLNEWSMPSQSRPTVRVLTSVVPRDAPPKAFARAIGERPSDNSFPIPEINSVDGLFSSAWLLVKSAEETGRLSRLIVELTKQSSDGVPAADEVLTLARIVAGDRRDEQLEKSLRAWFAAVVQRTRPPTIKATSDDPGQRAVNVLPDVALAAACLGHDRLQPYGESVLKKLLENVSQGSSPVIRPLLQRSHAVAVAKRYRALGDAQPRHWVAANGDDAALHARGGSRPLWLAHEEHILQLSGTRGGALLFRYPLTGEFEFSCEAQRGGTDYADGGLVYGGLNFLSHSGEQNLYVSNVDDSHVVKKPCPFIRSAKDAVFTRMSLRSTATGATFTVNGYPVWEDSRTADLSPWIGLRAIGRPLFRGLKISGSPVIPREVRLVGDDAMRGWQSTFFGERQPSFVAATSSGEPSRVADWYGTDGTIHHAKRDVQLGANRQSLLQYQRPLLDGEAITYEFYYKPEELEVHPSLGRLAFLIEPEGVRLHWITDGENEWTGLSDDNAIVEPFNRRGARPLPLLIDDWNRVSISLGDDAVTLSLNDKVIYERPAEPESRGQFGLFHDRRHSAVRVRNVVMTGEWPETLPADMLSDLAAATPSNPPDADHSFLNEVFGEQDLATNVFAVRAQAASLPDEQRYAFLSDWVIPSRGRRSLRLGGALTTTHPAPPDAASPDDAGGQLVAPAYDLIDVAVRLDRLDQLRDRVAAVEPSDEDQQRARFALLFLIDVERGERTAAAESCEQLLALREKRDDFSVALLWPETLVVMRGVRTPQTRALVSDLCAHLHGILLDGRRSGLTALDHHLVSVVDRKSAETSGGKSAVPPWLANWFAASIETAKTRGAGHPPARWRQRGSGIDKVVPHDVDLLYYRIPLTGDFDVECSTSPYPMQRGGLLLAGVFQEVYNGEIFREGTLRSKQVIPFTPPLPQLGKSVRIRIRVRDGVCKTFLNGREISSRELPEHYEPWLAAYSFDRHLSVIRDLRITGNPVVPDEIELTADQQLLGWLSYFGDDVGTADSNAEWRFLDDPAGGVVSIRQPAIAGSYRESLLQYHRPMAEDGTIEYEFYYQPGETVAHPALDRLAFLLDPGGVKIHWVTDGEYAPAGSDPTNQTLEPEHRRGGEVLPLRANSWNKMAVKLRGDTVELTLNGQLIYERPLEVTNQRTFGLFHFADQTEVRVRGVTLRGDWPKSVPPAAGQQLADKTVSSLDETRAKLPAVFSHTFAADSFPSEYFDAAPRNSNPAQQFEPRADGLFTRVTAREMRKSLMVLPRFTVQGDFDIEVGFDQLELRSDYASAIYLGAEVAGEHRPFHRLLRIQQRGDIQRVQTSTTLLRPDGSRTYDSHRFDSCESVSGRLRLARRGETIYYLFAEGDSTAFRLIDSRPGSAAETVPGGIRFQAEGNGTFDNQVVWKNMTIRAEKMVYFPPDDVSTERKLAVMNADGSEVREVTGPPAGYTTIGSPEWSADGKQIAFDVTPGNFADSHIVVVNTDGTGVQDRGPGAMPSFSPDGKRIVFCQPGSGVMMMHADGSNREDIDAGGWGAQWSPDGKWIACGRGGNIIVINAETKQEKPLLVGDQAALFDYTYWNLGWSHDSRSIAFKARNQATGGDDIVVADIDSPRGFKILIASSTGVRQDFSFSPDNKRLLFAMNNPEHKRPQLYTLDRENGGPPQLLPGQPLDWKFLGAAWSPDGKQIAFTGEKIPQPVPWPIAEAPASKP